MKAFFRAFGGPPRPDAGAPAPRPTTPDGVVLYAVGDVHGRLDLLNALLQWIASDARETGMASILVMLGDYIDRGAESAGVIDRLASLGGEAAMQIVCLRGNHEQAMLDFLEDPGTGPGWMRYGATETLRAYGVRPPGRDADLEDWVRAAEDLARAMPSQHRRFLEQTRLSFDAGDYLFVHAGVRPGVAMADQDADDLTTIREPFLSCPDPLPEKVVVFGHTPSEAPRLEPRKIGLDTGAYATGVLTALRLSGTHRRLIQSVLEQVRPTAAQSGADTT